MFSLESPHGGDSNEYTQYIIFNIKTKVTLKYPKSAAMGFFSKGLKNEFETAVVNEPSVFEPLKVYCNSVKVQKRCGRMLLFMFCFITMSSTKDVINFVLPMYVRASVARSFVCRLILLAVSAGDLSHRKRGSYLLILPSSRYD